MQNMYPPIEQVTKPNLTTSEAAFYCNRKPQTLRAWACLKPAGMPQPMNINGRLAWRLSDIKALLGIGV
jgi:hypothetical protein